MKLKLWETNSRTAKRFVPSASLSIALSASCSVRMVSLLNLKYERKTELGNLLDTVLDVLHRSCDLPR